MNNTFEIIEAIERLIEDGNGIFEIRAPKTKNGTISGYYDRDHIEKAAKAILSIDGTANIFITLNDFNPDLLCRSKNRLEKYAKNTTADQDILRRKWFLIDFDPVRSAGISATAKEKSNAKDTMIEVLGFLTEMEWPSPLVADSGNGYHLLYKIDLPNEKQYTEILSNVLTVIDTMFGNKLVEIDKSVAKAAQLSKLYGTMAVKGDNTEDRPHRRSELIFNKDTGIVSLEQIKKLADKLPDKNNLLSHQIQNNGPINIDTFCQGNGIKIIRTKPLQEATLSILDECVFNPDHSDAHIIQWPNGAIKYGCFHDSCKDKTWKDVLKVFGHNTVSEVKTSNKRGNNVDELIKQSIEIDEFLHDSMGVGWVKISQDGVPRTIKILSDQYNSVLVHRSYRTSGIALGKETILKAITTLNAYAQIDAPKRDVFTRIAFVDGNIIYNLGNDVGEVIIVNENGWETSVNSPVLFKYSQHAISQVLPKKASPEHLFRLFEYVNIVDPGQQLLLLISVVSSFIPGIPHAISIFHGEKGSAKTTGMKLIQKLIDPGHDLLSLPTSDQNLVLTLSNNYLCYFDNVDKLSSDKSDILCRATTGAGIAKRKLYTDNDEIILPINCLIGLNGINIATSRPDLLDRALLFELSRLGDNERRPMDELNDEFEREKPLLLGAIFSILVDALKIYPTVELKQLPRMADFTKWGFAIAEAIGGKGQEFLDVYKLNQRAIDKEAIESNPVATTIIDFMKNRHEWNGPFAELYDKLSQRAGQTVKSSRWPKGSNILSLRLKEIKSNLESIGISYELGYNNANCRIISLINNNVTDNYECDEDEKDLLRQELMDLVDMRRNKYQ